MLKAERVVPPRLRLRGLLLTLPLLWGCSKTYFAADGMLPFESRKFPFNSFIHLNPPQNCVEREACARGPTCGFYSIFQHLPRLDFIKQRIFMYCERRRVHTFSAFGPQSGSRVGCEHLNLKSERRAPGENSLAWHRVLLSASYQALE